jgi:hypothetical protein
MDMAQRTSEVWETTTEGTIWVQVKDTRNPGAWTQRRVGGKGSKRLTITTDEREFNQETLPYENQHLDPFTNGLLVRVSPKTAVPTRYELTDDDLLEKLADRRDDLFLTYLAQIDSEVIMRRLLALAREHSTMARHEVIKEIIEGRYAVGKTSQVVAEEVADGQKYADTDL